jgi:hypothetical protein
MPFAIFDLPGALQGIEVKAYLVIDNASTDLTAEVARQTGVHHVIYLPVKGLGGHLYRQH